MRKTSVIINKLSFFNDLIVKLDIDINSVKVRKHKQFLHLFSSLKDFRIQGKCKYNLEDLLLIIFFAKINEEGESCTSIERYARYQASFLYEQGLIKKDENGDYLVPSHDCFRYFLLNFDPNEIKKAFIDRFMTFYDNIYKYHKNESTKEYSLINIDGQDFRGTGRSIHSNNPRSNLGTLNIYDASSYLCIYSEAITKKESEIPTARKILTYLSLKGKIITADSLHTQIETSKIIIDRHGDYVFRVKENQSSLLKEIEIKFNDSKKIKVIETKERVFEFIKLPKTYIGVGFEKTRKFIKVKSKMKKNLGETLYFISSLENEIAIKEAIENRWEIENGLHKVKDCYLNEDEFRLKDKTAVENFSVINNVIVAFYRIIQVLLQEKQLINVKKAFKFQPMETLELIITLISTNELEKSIKEKIKKMEHYK